MVSHDEQQPLIQSPSVTIATRLTNIEQRVSHVLSVDVATVQERLQEHDVLIQSLVDLVQSLGAVSKSSPSPSICPQTQLPFEDLSRDGLPPDVPVPAADPRQAEQYVFSSPSPNTTGLGSVDARMVLLEQKIHDMDTLLANHIDDYNMKIALYLSTRGAQRPGVPYGSGAASSGGDNQSFAAGGDSPFSMPPQPLTQNWETRIRVVEDALKDMDLMIAMIGRSISEEDDQLRISTRTLRH